MLFYLIMFRINEYTSSNLFTRSETDNGKDKGNYAKYDPLHIYQEKPRTCIKVLSDHIVVVDGKSAYIKRKIVREQKHLCGQI